MSLWQDVRLAARVLVKERWFALVTMSALAIGIGLNATVFTLVNAVLIRDLPFAEPDRVVHVGTHDLRANRDRGVSYPEFAEWRNGAVPSLATAAAYTETTMNVTEGGAVPERYVGSYLSAPAFRILGVSPLLGRDFDDRDDQPGALGTVILGHGLWTRRFDGDPGVLGRTIRVNGVPATVIGVMPEKFRFPIVAELWQPLAFMPGLQEQTRDARVLGVAARLADGVSVSQADTAVNLVSERLARGLPSTNANFRGRVIPFSERYIVPQLRMVFLTLLGAVGFVLLIACANVANLLLARASRRLREMAIRTAIGATRWRIVRQLLVESVLLSMAAGALGLWIAVLGVRVFSATVENTGKPYWIEFTIDWTVIAYLTIVCIGTGIVFGIAPALQVSNTNANDILKEGGRSGSGGRRAMRWTSALVVTEVALTLVLLSGAGLMMKSFLTLYRLDLGANTPQLLTARLDLPAAAYPTADRRMLFFDQLQQRLAGLPAASATSMATAAPAGGGVPRELVIGDAGRATEALPTVTTVLVGAGYFEALGLPLAAGRPLTDVDGGPGSLNVVVNQQLKRAYFPQSDPVGQTIRLRHENNRSVLSPAYTIVGIAPTVRQRNFDEPEPDAVVYLPLRAEPPTAVTLLVRAREEPVTLTGALREQVKATDPDLPVFNVMTMDQFLAELRWPYRVFGGMFTIFAAFALILSMVGLYAVTAHSVVQRTQEIGIRMALGAPLHHVWWLIMRRAAIQLGVGVFVGAVGAVLVGQALSSVLVGTGSRDVSIMAILIGLLTFVALAAMLIPARRVARVHPTTALTSE